MPLKILLLLLSPILLVGGVSLLISILPLLVIGLLFSFVVDFVFTLSKLTLAVIFASIGLVGMVFSQGYKFAVYMGQGLHNLGGALLGLTADIADATANVMLNTYSAVKNVFKSIFNAITSIFKKAPDSTPSPSYTADRNEWATQHPSAPPLCLIRTQLPESKNADLIPVAEIVHTYELPTSRNNHTKSFNMN